MKRTALITGATGFVGSHLSERLSREGWHLRALVRPTSDRVLLTELGVEFIEGDLESRDALSRAMRGVDTVFHLAAITAAPNEAAYQAANGRGTRGVVDALLAAEERPRRLVYLSSYAACGPAPAGRARRVEDAPAPISAYGRSKLAGEAMVREAEAGGVEVSIIRAPAVYGPRDRALLTYFRLVRWGLALAPAGGERRRLHMIYAPDLACALARAADALPGTYPVAEPVAHTFAELSAAIARAMGRRPLRIALPPALVRAAAGATESIAGLAGNTPAFNREKAEEMLAAAWVCDLGAGDGLLPPGDATSLAEGLSQTVQWYKRQGWL
jgi:nucleoside-diphosphate-sugar epimerase